MVKKQYDNNLNFLYDVGSMENKIKKYADPLRICTIIEFTSIFLKSL